MNKLSEKEKREKIKAGISVEKDGNVLISGAHGSRIRRKKNPRHHVGSGIEDES